MCSRETVVSQGGMFAVIVIMLMLIACGGRKQEILNEKAMEEMLFDYYLAESMLRQQSADSIQQHLVLDALFEKHHTTRAVFDSSMVYYATHADKLYDMYEHLSDRLTNFGRLQGIENGTLISTYSVEGDTANIWRGDTYQLMTTYVPSNLIKYTISADSTFLCGDRFILSFHTDFLYQERSRNGFAMFSVLLANDSVITRTKLLTQDDTHTLEIADETRLGVKEIRGYFLLRTPANGTQSGTAPLRLLFLSDIMLIKMHTEVPTDFLEEEESSVSDSLTLQSDSINIQRKDSIKE